MMASLAESNSVSMSQNISWGFHKNAQRGKVPLSKCLGYRITKDRKYVIDEEIAPYIKKLFQMKLESYLNQEMIDYLKDQHIKTTKGSDITNATQLKCILTVEKYICQLTYGKTYIKKMNNDKVTMINNGEKPKYIIRNHHEGIIDHDTFNQVQEFFC